MIERLSAVAARCGASEVGELNEQHLLLDGSARNELAQGLGSWQAANGTERLWSGDASLWTDADESKWVGWLSLVAEFFEDEQEAPLREIALEIDAELGMEPPEGAVPDGPPDALPDGPPAAPHAVLPDTLPGALPGEVAVDSPCKPAAVVLLGMGGSSLGPEVLARTLAAQRPLFVLDTTDPSHIARVEAELDFARTVFVVSSKSGTTLETSLLFDYFYAKVALQMGEDRAGHFFVAVTDRGSKLAALAIERNLRACFWGKESVGGRFSVLSNFGLVPAALAGIDSARLMQAAMPMVIACAQDTPGDNPAVALGIVLAQAAQRGRDKVTIFGSESLAAFGAWADQLLAESTGKDGKGLIPIDLEGPLAATLYGDDRLFVSIELVDRDAQVEPEDDPEQVDLDARIQALVEAGHPVIRVIVHDEYAITQEFFRWQFATAVASSLLGVHPFGQPDVEGSKVESRRLSDAFEATGALPYEEPFVEGTTSLLFADPENQKRLLTPGDATVSETLTAHLGRIEPGDYFAILAYMDRNVELTEFLQSMRRKVAQHFGVATCLGFGPRFLHSTGQVYKGGPNSGVFVQITHEENAELEIPGHGFSFGTAKAAQARGDYEVMARRGRRLLRIHYKGKLVAGLQRLDGLVGRSLHSLGSD